MYFRSLIVTCLVVAYPVVAVGQASPASAGATSARLNVGITWFLGGNR